MLSVLDLVRRLDAGEIKPRAVVDLCAEAIAAREPEIGAFVALGIEAAQKAGCVRLRQIAEALMARGVKTPGGCTTWDESQVRRTIAKATGKR